MRSGLADDFSTRKLQIPTRLFANLLPGVPTGIIIHHHHSGACPSRQPRTSSLLDLALTMVNVTLRLASNSRYCQYILCSVSILPEFLPSSAVIRNNSRSCPKNSICIFQPLSFTPYSSNTSWFVMRVVHSNWKWIANFFSESADLRRVASKGDMIDSIVDRLYRPSRISNRMRLAKLLLLLLEGNGYDPSIHISTSIRCHHRRQPQQVKRHKRSDVSLIRSRRQNSGVYRRRFSITATRITASFLHGRFCFCCTWRTFSLKIRSIFLAVVCLYLSWRGE